MSICTFSTAFCPILYACWLKWKPGISWKTNFLGEGYNSILRWREISSPVLQSNTRHRRCLLLLQMGGMVDIAWYVIRCATGVPLKSCSKLWFVNFDLGKLDTFENKIFEEVLATLNELQINIFEILFLPFWNLSLH